MPKRRSTRHPRAEEEDPNYSPSDASLEETNSSVTTSEEEEEAEEETLAKTVDTPPKFNNTASSAKRYFWKYMIDLSYGKSLHDLKK